jgi:hypothetical protein
VNGAGYRDRTCDVQLGNFVINEGFFFDLRHVVVL